MLARCALTSRLVRSSYHASTRDFASSVPSNSRHARCVERKLSARKSSHDQNRKRFFLFNAKNDLDFLSVDIYVRATRTADEIYWFLLVISFRFNLAQPDTKCMPTPSIFPLLHTNHVYRDLKVQFFKADAAKLAWTCEYSKLYLNEQFWCL